MVEKYSISRNINKPAKDIFWCLNFKECSFQPLCLSSALLSTHSSNLKIYCTQAKLFFSYSFIRLNYECTGLSSTCKYKSFQDRVMFLLFLLLGLKLMITDFMLCFMHETLDCSIAQSVLIWFLQELLMVLSNRATLNQRDLLFWPTFSKESV